MWEWNLADQEEVHALLSAVLPHLKNPAKREEARKAMDAISTREPGVEAGTRPTAKSPGKRVPHLL